MINGKFLCSFLISPELPPPPPLPPLKMFSVIELFNDVSVSKAITTHLDAKMQL